MSHIFTALFNSSFSYIAIEVLLQVILFCLINKFAQKQDFLWWLACQKLSLFTVLLSSSHLFYSLNSLCLHWTVPIIIRALILLFTSIPLLSLWIDIPSLLIKRKQIKTKISPKPELIDSYTINHSEVTDRILKSLKRLDKGCVVFNP